MELRTRDYSSDARKRLGEALTERRVEVDPRWANRAEFLRATGLNKKMVERLENGDPGNFRPATVAKIARGYQVTTGSLAKSLAGGTLDPAGPGGQPDLPPLAMSPEEEAITRAFLTALRSQQGGAERSAR